MTAPVRVLFLAGVVGSGAALLERTLAGTAGVTTLGEVRHLWERGVRRDEPCACGERFRECSFWTKVGDAAFGGWDSPDVRRMATLKEQVDRAARVPSIATGLPRELVRDVEAYVSGYERIYAAAYEITGDVLVDSSQQVSLAWCLQRSTDLDLRVVHCVRDSRAVAASWAREAQAPEAAEEGQRTRPTYSSRTFSARWTLHNLQIEALGPRVPLLRLRHEDFLADPVGGTRRVLDLAGVPAHADQVTATSVHLARSHSCAGDPIRFTTGDLAVGPDDHWRTELPAASRRAVTALTAPLLARYGYLRRARCPGPGAQARARS